jgi:hypothetical protein
LGLYGEKERYRPKGWAGRMDGINSLAVSYIWTLIIALTLENSHMTKRMVQEWSDL